MGRPRRTTHRRGAHQQSKPAGEIRQSQLLTTYGPGALVDLVDDAVIVGGLEYWSFGKGQRILDDTRLRDALAQRLEPEWKSRRLAVDKAFKVPPAGDSRDAQVGVGIRVFEFPQWFVCQNPGCRSLQGSRSLERKGTKYRHRCDVKTGGKDEWDCVPVRFVGACKSGHVQDFPWRKWVHEKDKESGCEGSRLKLWEGSSGDFSEVFVECVTCGARRRLTEALVEQGNPFCDGKRPWLGREANQICGDHLRLLIRTASNSYFAQVESSLWIPGADDDLRELVQANWASLENASPENLQVLRMAISSLKALEPFSDVDVLKIVKSIRNREPATQDLRAAEYQTFIAAAVEPPGDLPKKDSRFHAVRLAGSGVLPKGLERVVLAKRLREVRVQVGFTRLEPPSPTLQGEFDLGTRRAELGLNTNWLPAAEVNGEGIFVALSEAAVVEWESRPAVQAREAELEAGYDSWVDQFYGEGSKREQAPPAFPGARFFLLHSLSHMLITELALDCGYPASAIRERLYCAPADAAQPMAGILLMTGTSGADGTLGGLVEEGRRLDRHISRALEQNALCSNDPVCAYHTPAADLAERYLEGAACHGCLFVAECSCERFNKYLDRALVVPTIGHEGIAFFEAKG
jgi:hypothetical protein